MTTKTSLTIAIVDKLPVPSTGKMLTFDQHRDAPPGFGVVVTAKGTRSFVLRYSVDGRQRQKNIGQHPAWTVAAARAEARRLRMEIDKGSDPLDERRQRRREPTFGDVAGEWIEKHARKLRSGGEVERLVNRDLLPALGTLKISGLRRRDLIDALEPKFASAPRVAERLLGFTKQIFAYAMNREIVGADPTAGLKVSAFLSRSQRLKPRERVLSDDEIKSFWTAAPTRMDRLTFLALKLILLTGVRPEEAAGASLSEFTESRWVIPAERRKTAQPHLVTLTASALAVIEEAREEVDRRQKRRGSGEASFLFETRSGKPVTRHALSRAVLRSAVELGNEEPGWTPHDLRRTFRTRLAALGIPPHIAEEAVGHRRQGIVAVYDRHSYESEVADALRKWEARLLGIANIKA